jgi:hypothetical protein
VFFNISFMSFYKGKQNDKLEGNFRYIKENADGMEKNNFDPIVKDGNEYCYGYVEPGFTKGGYENGRQRQIHIEKILGADNPKEKLDRVLVIWCAKMPGTKRSAILGWYKNATVYRNVLTISNDMLNGRGLPNFGYWVNTIAAKEDCVLLPLKEREKDIWTAYRKNQNKDGFGFGQSNMWYAREDSAQGYVDSIITQIEHYQGENWV